MKLWAGLAGAAVVMTSMASVAQQHPRSWHPRDGQIRDVDTRAWWHTTEALSGDAMQGRDTGSAAYQRAAEYVAKRFEAAGLKPAGESGGYFQTVPMHQVDVEAKGTSFVVTAGERRVALRFLEDVMVTAADAPAEVNAGMVFRGYCGKDAMAGVAGKIVVCFGTQREGLPGPAERLANARAAGAAGMMTVDDPYFTIEPPRWPWAFSRTVSLRGGPEKQMRMRPFLVLRCSAEAFRRVLAGSGQDADAILKAGGAKEPLQSFDLPGYALEAHVATTEKDISSPNVIGVLPGTDPKLKDEYVVVAAHLDGYGFGTAVKGDRLYNGTLDDAAYVALLVQMAEDLKAGRAMEPGADASPAGRAVGVKLAPPKRSILFCAFTGEEKGLLGAKWFVEHPTVPLKEMAADINLDQLRPLFPLKILTALAIHDTTLGETATEVGSAMGIELREDREPERGLLRRADHFPFLQAGVPAIGFVFGFDAGTEAERRYREWYQVRYHRPQDDLTQPVDFEAAAKFNLFFYRLVERVADDAQRPQLILKAER